MSRPPLILRPVRIETTLPEDLHAKLMLYLYSPSAQCVPRGAFQKFLIDRIVEFFNSHEAKSNDS